MPSSVAKCGACACRACTRAEVILERCRGRETQSSRRRQLYKITSFIMYSMPPRPTLPSPPCRHADCTARRWGALTPCAHCQRLIGYGRLFIRRLGGSVHRECLEQKP